MKLDYAKSVPLNLVGESQEIPSRSLKICLNVWHNNYTPEKRDNNKMTGSMVMEFFSVSLISLSPV